MKRDKKETVKKKNSKELYTKDKSPKYDKNLGDKKQENHVPGHNDWRWYAPTEQIARDVASIPFNLISGTKWPNGVSRINGSDSKSIDTINPSVMAIDYALYAGGEQISTTDSINMAAKQLYTSIRKSNSGAKVYEATDVMIYVLAMREIYALYFHIKRILGVANAYSFLNRTLPEGLLHALGLSTSGINDLRANLATYRGRLNLIAASINSFAVPKYFKVFMRDAYLSSYIFSDSTSLAGQFYVFRLAYTRKWSATENVGGSSLVADVLNTGSTVAYLMDKLQTNLDALFYDTDANTMAGDIVKAFPESDLYRVGETPDNYVVIPGYDEDILNQINNMVWLPIGEFIQDSADLDIAQSDELIKSGYTFDNESAIAREFMPAKFIFNSHKDNPEYTDVLEWSRLYNFPVPTATDNSEFTIVGGSELILGVEIHMYNVNGNYSSDVIHSVLVIDAENPNIAAAVPQLIFSPVFDWHPYGYVMTSLGGAIQSLGYVGDLKRCTFVDSATLQRIHNAAVYSLFNTDRPFIMTK